MEGKDDESAIRFCTLLPFISPSLDYFCNLETGVELRECARVAVKGDGTLVGSEAFTVQYH